MDVVQILGQNVRRARKERGLSQEELALEAGMKRSYLSDLERGTRNPTVRAVGRSHSHLMWSRQTSYVVAAKRLNGA